MEGVDVPSVCQDSEFGPKEVSKEGNRCQEAVEHGSQTFSKQGSPRMTRSCGGHARHVGTLDEAGACLALSKIGLLEFQKGVPWSAVIGGGSLGFDLSTPK